MTQAPEIKPLPLIAVSGAGSDDTSLARLLLRLVPWGSIEALTITGLAIAVSMVLFGVFVALAGQSPVEVYTVMYKGAFGTEFAWGNTLTKAAPLLLTGLCTALPARLGMVIIGGEGAVVIGGLVAAAVAHAMGESSPGATLPMMLVTGAAAGGIWICIAGALKQYRGVNETISSLLLTYIAIALLNHMVDHGPLWDPTSLNKPSSAEIPEVAQIGMLDMVDVHYGLVFGIIACMICWVLMNHTTLGFAARIVGGNNRAAKMAGLSITRIAMTVCFLGGAAAGLAGVIQVAAVEHRANTTLAVGYGYIGILVAFLARHNPLAIIPVAVLLGGISASGGRLQRTLQMPDATTYVLQGILFVVILAFETFYGRIRLLQRK
jgi:simple sugar transport system permease protein